MQKNSAEQGDAPRGSARWIVSSVILAFCAGAYYLTTTFDRVPPILKRGIQPADFPQLVILLIAALAVWLMFKDREPAPDRQPPVVFVTLGLLLLFPLVAQIDFFVAIGLLSVVLSAVWGERRIWALLLVAPVMPAAVFFFFDAVFEIRFPRGLLTNLWYG